MIAWPPLDAAAATSVLAQYPSLGEVHDIAWHSSRPFAASGIVECAGGPVFVKRHDKRVRSAADLAEEHAFIAHVRARGCAVPAVLATHDGATAVNGADGCYEVHALAIGEDRYRNAPSWTPLENVDEARQMGAALARLHVAASDYLAPARETRLVVSGDWLMRAAEPALALDAWVAEGCAPSRCPVRAELARGFRACAAAFLCRNPR